MHDHYTPTISSDKVEQLKKKKGNKLLHLEVKVSKHQFKQVSKTMHDTETDSLIGLVQRKKPTMFRQRLSKMFWMFSTKLKSSEAPNHITNLSLSQTTGLFKPKAPLLLQKLQLRIVWLRVSDPIKAIQVFLKSYHQKTAQGLWKTNRLLYTLDSQL